MQHLRKSLNLVVAFAFIFGALFSPGSNTATAGPGAIGPILDFQSSTYEAPVFSTGEIDALLQHGDYSSLSPSILADGYTEIKAPDGISLEGQEIELYLVSGGSETLLGSLTLGAGSENTYAFWMSEFSGMAVRPPLKAESNRTYNLRFKFVPGGHLLGQTLSISSWSVGDINFNDPLNCLVMSNEATATVEITSDKPALAFSSATYDVPVFSTGVIEATLTHGNYDDYPDEILTDGYTVITTPDGLSLDGLAITGSIDGTPVGPLTLSGAGPVYAFWISEFPGLEDYPRHALNLESGGAQALRFEFEAEGRLLGQTLTLESWSVAAEADAFDDPQDWFIASETATATVTVSGTAPVLTLSPDESSVPVFSTGVLDMQLVYADYEDFPEEILTDGYAEITTEGASLEGQVIDLYIISGGSETLLGSLTLGAGSENTYAFWMSEFSGMAVRPPLKAESNRTYNLRFKFVPGGHLLGQTLTLKAGSVAAADGEFDDPTKWFFASNQEEVTIEVTSDKPALAFSSATYDVPVFSTGVIEATLTHGNYDDYPDEILTDGYTVITAPDGLSLDGLAITGSIDGTPVGPLTLSGAGPVYAFWISEFPGPEDYPRHALNLESGGAQALRFEFEAEGRLLGQTLTLESWSVAAEADAFDDPQDWFIASDSAVAQVKIVSDAPALEFQKDTYEVPLSTEGVIDIDLEHGDYSQYPDWIRTDGYVEITAPDGVNMQGFEIEGFLVNAGVEVPLGNIRLSGTGPTYSFWMSAFENMPYRPPFNAETDQVYHLRFKFFADSRLLNQELNLKTWSVAAASGNFDNPVNWFITSNEAATTVKVAVTDELPTLAFTQAHYNVPVYKTGVVEATLQHTADYSGYDNTLLTDGYTVVTAPDGVSLDGMAIGGKINSIDLGVIVLRGTGPEYGFWISEFPNAPDRHPLNLESNQSYDLSFTFTPNAALSGQTLQVFSWSVAAAALDFDHPEAWFFASEPADATVLAYNEPAITSDDIPTVLWADEEREFHILTENPATGIPYEKVLFEYRLTDTELDDIELFQYYDTDDGQWKNLGPIQDGTDVVGFFGPQPDFPMASPYSANTLFRIEFEPGSGGLREFTLELVDKSVEPNIVLSDLDGTILIYDRPLLTSDDLPLNALAGEEVEFTIDTVNPPGGKDYTNARFNFRIENLALENVEYFRYPTVAGTWADIDNLTQDGDDVIGYYGPSVGFPMPSDYEEDTTFKVKFKTGGIYEFSLSVVDLAQDPVETVATLESTASFYPIVEVLADSPLQMMVGQFDEVNIRAANLSGTALPSVVFRYRIADVQAADVQLEYPEDDGTWHALNPTQDGDDIVGHFGNSAGFEMVGNYDVTIPLRATFFKPGSHEVTIELFDVSSDEPALLAQWADTLTVTGQAGAELDPLEDEQCEYPGKTVSYTVMLTNLGNMEDTFTLSLNGNEWDTTLSETSVTLDPDESINITVTVEVPTGAAEEQDSVVVSAVSTNDPTCCVEIMLTTTRTLLTTFLPLVIN